MYYVLVFFAVNSCRVLSGRTRMLPDPKQVGKGSPAKRPRPEGKALGLPHVLSVYKAACDVTGTPLTGHGNHELEAFFVILSCHFC